MLLAHSIHIYIHLCPISSYTQWQKQRHASIFHIFRLPCLKLDPIDPTPELAESSAWSWPLAPSLPGDTGSRPWTAVMLCCLNEATYISHSTTKALRSPHHKISNTLPGSAAEVEPFYINPSILIGIWFNAATKVLCMFRFTFARVERQPRHTYWHLLTCTDMFAHGHFYSHSGFMIGPSIQVECWKMLKDDTHPSPPSCRHDCPPQSPQSSWWWLSGQQITVPSSWCGASPLLRPLSPPPASPSLQQLPWHHHCCCVSLHISPSWICRSCVSLEPFPASQAVPFTICRWSSWHLAGDVPQEWPL